MLIFRYCRYVLDWMPLCWIHSRYYLFEVFCILNILTTTFSTRINCISKHLITCRSTRRTSGYSFYRPLKGDANTANLALFRYTSCVFQITTERNSSFMHGLEILLLYFLLHCLLLLVVCWASSGVSYFWRVDTQGAS